MCPPSGASRRTSVTFDLTSTHPRDQPLRLAGFVFRLMTSCTTSDKEVVRIVPNLYDGVSNSRRMTSYMPNMIAALGTVLSR